MEHPQQCPGTVLFLYTGLEVLNGQMRDQNKQLFHKGAGAGQGTKLLISCLWITLCTSLTERKLFDAETIRRQKKISAMNFRIQKSCGVLQ